MDKQLLKALDNLSVGLEQLAEALKSKGSPGQSDTSTALQAGDFSKSLEQISVEIKSIKTDTQEILKNQQTLIGLYKQKEQEKKTDELEGSNPKKESQIKKGVASILLIAVAVLAIGLAFKLVGKVNIISVLALGIGIVLVAYAFEKVAKIKGASGGPMTIKEAFVTTAIMVIAAGGITVSSWILSKVSTISIGQMISIASIALLFTFIGPALSKLIKSMTTSQEVEFEGVKMKTEQMSWGTILGTVVMLPLLMLSMSIGIMISSKVLASVSPISLPQMLTTILIGLMFAVIARGIAGLITAFTTSQEASGGGFGFKTQSIGFGKLAAVVLALPLVMFMIAKGVAWSSYALASIKPIGFMQAITAILIAGMFAVVSMGIAKLINSLNGTNPVAILLLPVVMVAIAYAIALSAEIFSNYKKSFDSLGWGTIFRILLLGASISVIAFLMGFAVKTLGGLNLETVILLPMLLTTMALAIAASAWIFAKPEFKKAFDQINFMMIFKILLLGAAMAIVTAIVGFASKYLDQLDVKKVILYPVLYTLLSMAVAVSAWVFAKFKSSFDKLDFAMIFKILFFGVALAVALVATAFAAKLINKMLSITDAIKGGIVMVIIAGIITASSWILSKGTYKNYPTLKWTLGVAAAVAAFAVGLVLLGTQLMNPVFWMGLPVILSVAATIVGVSYVLAKGKYNLPGFGEWAKATVLLFATFTPLILVVGAVGMAAAAMSLVFGDSANPFKVGGDMLKEIANTIVDVSYILGKGKYVGGPSVDWASGISIALGAFSPVYEMLVRNSVMKAFGMGGVGPDDFSKAIKTVSKGIISAAWFFSMNKAAFINGPSEAWASGVGKAIGAFAPVFVALNENTGWMTSGKDAVDDMVYGISAITYGIIASAKIFAENKATFDDGYPSTKWGKGVGASLKAFNPVFKALHEDTGWFTSGEKVVNQMTYGITSIAWALVSAASAFVSVKPESWQAYPSSEWAKGVSKSVVGFMDLFDTIESRGYTATGFSINSSILSVGVKAMTNIAKMLWKSKNYFTVKLDPNFIKNLSSNVLAFADLATKLDKMLVTEKMVTTSEWGGLSKSTKMVRERKDLSLVKDVTLQMAQVASILFRNKGAFDMKIDPYFMRKVGQNLIDFSQVVKKIAEVENKGSTFLGRLGSSIEGALGTDPVSQITRKMVTLAKGYDAMATALLKLGAALRVLKLKDLSELGSITKGLSSGNIDISHKISPVKTKSLYSVSEEKKKRRMSDEEQKKNEILYVSKKLDEAVTVLKAIRANTGNIDNFVSAMANKPKESPDVKTK